MGSTRRHRVVVVLLVCLPAIVLLGGVPAVAWRLTGSHHAPHHETHVAEVWEGVAPVRRGAAPVQISGSVDASLSPGVSVPVDLRMVNPNTHAVTIRRVRVGIAEIVAPAADAAHPCTRLDFEIRQMPKRLLRLPAHRTTGLSGLGLPPWAWPRLGMRNRPLNQDGCKGARLTFSYQALPFRRWHR
jgi:hypothetical protein